MAESSAAEEVHCIYCIAALAADTKVAHVWPASMGGRLKSRRICCDDCNNHIGKGEGVLLEALRRPFASVGAVDDRGVPVAVRLERAGLTFDLADGNAALRESGVRFDAARKSVVVPLPAGLKEQSRKAANAMRSHGLTADDVDRFHLEPGDPPPVLPEGPTYDEYDLSVGRRREHKQVLVKMALELLAFHRHDLATRPELADARWFARRGGDVAGRATFDTRSRGSGLVPLDGLPRVFNAIETWSVGASIYFRAVFLGPLGFTGRLTSDWRGPEFRVAYAFDARDPANLVVSTFDTQAGYSLATWSLRNEAQHCADAIEEISRELAEARSTTPPTREPPPDRDQLRAAIREQLLKQPPKRTPGSKK